GLASSPSATQIKHLRDWLTARRAGARGFRYSGELGFQHGRDLPPQFWDQFGRRVPDDLPVEPKVLVHDDVSERDDFRPRRRWVGLTKRLRKAACCLPGDVGEEALAVALREVHVNAIGSLDDVEKVE